MDTLNHLLIGKIVPVIEKENLRDVCDYGCGEGRLANLLKETLPTLRLTGVDRFRQMATPPPEASEGVRFIDRDMSEFDCLPQSGFDLLISTFTLHHFRTPVAELQRLASLVKPGGYLWFCDHNVDRSSQAGVVKSICSFIGDLQSTMKGDWHRRFFTVEEATDLLASMPVETVNTEILDVEMSAGDLSELKEKRLQRVRDIRKAIEANSTDFWKSIWLPLVDYEKQITETYGFNHKSIWTILLRKKTL